MSQQSHEVPAQVAFPQLLRSLVTYFAGEPAAVSVNTERFGTIHRDQVAGLLALAESRERECASGDYELTVLVSGGRPIIVALSAVES